MTHCLVCEMVYSKTPDGIVWLAWLGMHGIRTASFDFLQCGSFISGASGKAQHSAIGILYPSIWSHFDQCGKRVPCSNLGIQIADMLHSLFKAGLLVLWLKGFFFSVMSKPNNCL